MTIPLPAGDRALIAAAAVLLTLAYPPYALVLPPFLCLVPAALLVLRGRGVGNPLRRHLHQGFWYGVVTQAVLLSWLWGALARYHWAATVLYLVAIASFGGASAVLFALVGRATRASPGRILVALPAAVVALEWLTEQLGAIAFPWHRLALTVTPYPVLVQAADLFGSGGLGYLIVTVNACLALAWWTRRTPGAALRHLETAAVVLFVLTAYGLHRLSALELEAGEAVAVVQPNVGLEEKWRPERADAIVERTARLTEEAIAGAADGLDLVVWPETALPGLLGEHPAWTVRLNRLAAVQSATLLVGGMRDRARTAAPFSPSSDNVVLAVSPRAGAAPAAVHTKRRLVPLVERSLRDALAPHRDRASDAPAVAEGAFGPYGALVCFELTFESPARSLRRSGARTLVTVSNDAWLGRSAAPHQHFAHAILRAVENRVTVVRAANTGVSGIVDPLGRVEARAEPFTATFAAGRLQRVSATPPAVRFGGWAGPLSGALLLVLVLASRTPADLVRNRISELSGPAPR